MAEIWLQANWRAFVIPTVLAVLLGVGCAFGAYAVNRDPASVGSALHIGLVIATVVFLLTGSGLIAIALTPRISYADGRVKFFVRFGPPVEVPLEHVEAFLIGRGPIFFNDDRTETKETTTLIVRIAERAEEYHHVKTAPLLAAWCGNQATIRGTWTEPLGLELVNRLNQRLYDVKQERAGATGAT